MDPRDTRKWTAPQLAAELTSADYSANVDPAMAAILKFSPGNSLGKELTDALAAGGYTEAAKRYGAYRKSGARLSGS